MSRQMNRCACNGSVDSVDRTVARGLGWASIAIGLTELAAPRQVEHLLGLEPGRYTGTLRTLGVREVMHGVDLLAHEEPEKGLWARVAGDGLDGVLLGVAATKTRRPTSFAIVSSLVVGIALTDLLMALRLGR